MKVPATIATKGRGGAASGHAASRRTKSLAPAKATQAVAAARKTEAAPKRPAPADKPAPKPAAKAAPAQKPVPTKAAVAKAGSAKAGAAKAGQPAAPAAKPASKPAPATAAAKPVAVPAVPKPAPAAVQVGPKSAAAASQAQARPPAVQPPPPPVSPPATTTTPPQPDRRPAMPDRLPARPMAKAEVFVEGDHVVYPTHGVGKVEKIATEEIAGHQLELIHITFEENRMTLRVPVAKARTAGLRKLATRKLFDEALAVLKGRARIKRTMWSRRAQEYDAKINSGDPLAIAEVVRDLHRNAGQPDQSFSERQIYEAAMDRLAAELAALDKTDKPTAAGKLSSVLKTV